MTAKETRQISLSGFYDGDLNYSCGPAATRDLPSSLPVYFTKFLMKRPARSFALVYHSEASA